MTFVRGSMGRPGVLSAAIVLFKMTLSNRWAKPERPFGSSFEPTSYQTCTETLAVDGSRSAYTFRPLARVREV